jgi:hypothetical protein
VSENAAAIATLEGSSAIYQVLVEASESTPALVRLLSGLGGSEIALVADVLRFINDLPGQGPIEAMRVQSGVVEIIQALVLATGATIKSADGRMEIGQLSNGGFGLRFLSPTDDTLMVYDQTNEVFRIAPEFLAPGSLGVRTRKTLSLHALNNGGRRLADCNTLTLSTDPVPNVPNMIYEAEAQYRIQAQKNSFEWFGFADRLIVEGNASPTAWIETERQFSAASSTGWAPGSGVSSLIVSREHNRALDVQANSLDPAVYPNLYAHFGIRAINSITGDTNAYTSSGFNSSLTQSTHRITGVRLVLAGYLSGPTVIV